MTPLWWSCLLEAADPGAFEHLAHAGRQSLRNLVPLRCKKTGETADVDAARADLLADEAHDQRRQHAEQRGRLGLSEARKAADRAGKR